MDSTLCTNYQPSLLRGLRTNYSILTSWEEMYRIITQDNWVKEQTQLYRATHDDKYKHALPAVTTAVQLDGRGKAVENIVGFTGVTHCDFDHIPAARLAEVIAKIKADPHTLLCNVSPSGDGVHIYARFSLSTKDTEEHRNDLNYFDAFMTANCYYADLLNLPFDEQCSNPNKTLSLSHDSDAYYNPNADAFVVAHTDSTDLTDELYPTIEDTASKQTTNDNKPTQENLLNPLNPYATKTHWVKEYSDPIEFAEKYVREKQGLTYSGGYRNAYLYNCLNMINLLGVARTDAESWLRNFDLPEREKLSILKSSYKRTADFGKFERPYVWREEAYTPSQSRGQRQVRQQNFLSCTPTSSNPHTHAPETDDEAERKEEEERDRRCPRLNHFPFPDFPLPKFIQQMVDCGETKPQQDVIRLSAITTLGAMAGSLLRFMYARRTWHPAIQLFVVAPPASGKSVVSLVRRVAEPLHDQQMDEYEELKKAYDSKKAAYDIAGKERANMEMPVPPVMKMFLIAGNNSSTGILENLADADGWALICESEADTLSAAINADYGNWDDTLRKAYDHDRLSYNRRTNKEYRQIKNPCLGVLICGTPAQVKPLIPSAENGLFSRQLFATLPPIDEFVDQFGSDGIDLNAKFLGWGKEWTAVLSLIKSEVNSIELRLTDQQKKVFNDEFDYLFGKAESTRLDYHMKSAVAREAINLLRIMCVVAFFRAIEGIDFHEIHEKAATDEVHITRLLLNCPGLEAAEGIPADNIKDGICGRFILHITDEDMRGVLDMAEPLYDTACDILTLIPWTEAERIQLSPMEQLLGSMPRRFTRKEIVERGAQKDILEATIDSKLRRMCRRGQLTNPETGVYEFTRKSSPKQ